MAHSQWSSPLSFIIVSTAAMVGLGNIWHFSTLVGMNGGGAFVIVYLLFVFVLGIPMMSSEILIGRRSMKNPVDAYRMTAIQSLRSTKCALAGGLQIITGLLILTYYCVISGWILHYISLAARNKFQNISIEGASQAYAQLLNAPLNMAFWDTLFIIAVVFTISLHIRKRLEKVIVLALLGMLTLIVTLIIYAFETSNFAHGLNYLFQPDFSKLTARSILIALGQAFFSLGIGTGIMMTYGTYVTKETSILKSCSIIAISDCVIALLAGMTIFPLVFANNLSPDLGFSLIFQTLPVAFGHMPLGRLFGTLFFILLEMTTFISAIALLMPTVLYCREAFTWRRTRSAILAGIVVWVLSIGVILSFNIAKDIKIMGLNFFEFLDFLTGDIMLPIGGLLVAIMTGWIMFRKDTSDELDVNPRGAAFRGWRFAIRYLAPVAILMIFCHLIGLF
jgi:NSS family neurotransmitter:Na+ symporter